MDDGSVEILLKAGATEEEARCIAAATADAPDPEGEGPEAISQAISEAVLALAGDCAPPDRLEEIATQVTVVLEEEFAAVSEPVIQEIARRYEAAGAQTEEARCIAEVVLAQSRSLSNEGNAAARAEAIAEVLREEGQHCGAPERLRELSLEVFVSPLVATLRDAGATEREATCVVDKIESIEIFLPSEDFNGPDSAEMAGDRFVENAPGCSPPDRLRKIVRTAFKQYIEGCTRSSDDPMAPYDC